MSQRNKKEKEMKKCEKPEGLMGQLTSGSVYALREFQKRDRERKRQSAYWKKYWPNLQI